MIIFAASFISGVTARYSFPYFPFLSLICLSAFLFFLVKKKRFAPIAVFALGLLFALLRVSPGHPAPRGEASLAGVFVSSPVPSKSGGFFWRDFRVRASPKAEKGVRLPSDIRVLSSISVTPDRGFEVGRVYELKVRVSRPAERLNPAAAGRRPPYAVLLGVRHEGERDGSIRARFGRARERLENFYRDTFEPAPASLLMAVTTGQRAYLDSEIREAFSSAGLAHLLSISGTHFALFSVLLFWLLRAALRRLPVTLLERLTLHVTPSQAAALFTAPFLLFYLGISGGRIPTLRAFIMISLYLFGLLVGRKGGGLNFLLIAALALVIHDPEVLFDLSFELSFIAVLFIQNLLPFKNKAAEGGGAGGVHDAFRVREVLKKPLFVSLAASAGTAPIVAYHFNYVSIISPAANLLVTPLVGFLLVPVSLLGSFLYLMTGNYLLEQPSGALAGLTLFLTKAAASVPCSSISVPRFPVSLIVFFYTGALIYFSRPGLIGRASGFRLKACGLTLALLPLTLYGLIAFGAERSLNVTFLDAGHADSAVVELPDGRVIVIDAGRSGREAAEHLRMRGIKTIDALVLSHSHPDHARGASRLIGQFRVGEIWDSGRLRYPPGLLNGVARRTLERGDFYKGEGCSIRVLHPYKGFYTASGPPEREENNGSLVIKVEGKAKSFLFAGDIEEEAERDIARLGAGTLKSDVLKVPHHGGKTSDDEGFLEAVSPEVLVATAKKVRGDFGRGRLLITGRDGAVKIAERDGELVVKTCRDFKLKKVSGITGEIGNMRKLFTVW